MRENQHYKESTALRGEPKAFHGEGERDVVELVAHTDHTGVELYIPVYMTRQNNLEASSDLTGDSPYSV